MAGRVPGRVLPVRPVVVQVLAVGKCRVARTTASGLVGVVGLADGDGRVVVVVEAGCGKGDRREENKGGE